MNVTHLIVGLGKGGAETMLYQIIKKRKDESIKYSVISLGASHFYENKIREAGVPVCELRFKRHPVTSLIKTYKIIKKSDTLCCWMYHCNLIGYYLGRLARVKKIIWSIRHSNLDPELNKKTTLAIVRHCAKLSKNVNLITYNGYESQRIHESIGYSKDKSLVLENGCDLDEFVFHPEAKSVISEELGIPESKKIILSVSKYHPIKDIPTFIKAFSILHSKMNDTVAVLCGSGVDEDNEALLPQIKELNLNLGEDIFLLGMRHDVPVLLSSSDVYILHSVGEAFPNTLIQAMACSCLCISTDVGDAGRILGNTDWVIEKANPEVMATAAERIIELDETVKATIRCSNRERATDNYNIANIVEKYEEVYLK